MTFIDSGRATGDRGLGRAAVASPEMYEDPRFRGQTGGSEISGQALANATNSEFTNVYGSVGRDRRKPPDCAAPTYYVASWKGIDFFCDSSADEFGRRGDIYEYPLSDYIGYKDLGKKAERFKVEGYLIGADQLARAQIMRDAAIDPEPGTLVHPLFGRLQVGLVLLTMTADFRRDKKRTKLSFDFVEANASMAPFATVGGLESIFGAGNESIFVSQSGVWGRSPPPADALQLLEDFNRGLQQSFGIATDVESLDALDMLNRWGGATPATIAQPPQMFGRMEAPTKTPWLGPGETYPVTLKYATDPIDYASATIRRIHTDALKRLKEFNAFVVQRSEQLAMPSPSAQSLIITTRLIVLRDYGIAIARTRYDTVKAALDDLDFLMAAYDDEEAVATQRCDDVLVAAIRKARAIAAGVILARNVRLPGIAEYTTDGVWPSLVVAQKLYNDGRRYEQIENYNPHMTPFWMGGPPGQGVIAPAR